MKKKWWWPKCHHCYWCTPNPRPTTCMTSFMYVTLYSFCPISLPPLYFLQQSLNLSVTILVSADSFICFQDQNVFRKYLCIWRQCLYIKHLCIFLYNKRLVSATVINPCFDNNQCWKINLYVCVIKVFTISSYKLPRKQFTLKELLGGSFRA